MAITLYSSFTFIYHLFTPSLFFFSFFHVSPLTRQQKHKQKQTHNTLNNTNTASKAQRKSEASLKRFPALSSTLSTYRSPAKELDPQIFVFLKWAFGIVSGFGVLGKFCDWFNKPMID